MRVFLLDGVGLLDAARIAIQSLDPWASEVYCSIDDYIKAKLSADRTVFVAPRRHPHYLLTDFGSEELFYRKAQVIPEAAVPPGEIHVPFPMPPAIPRQQQEAGKP